MDWHCISIMFIIDRANYQDESESNKRQLPEVNQLLDILKKASKPELFREDEKNFYYEQKKITRISYSSEEIDLDYEEMVENRQKENQFQNKKDEEVAQLCEDINFEESNSDILNSRLKSTASSVTMSCSGLLRFEEEEKLPQTVERPKLRKISKTCTEEVKAACASVWSKCSIPAEKFRVAAKTVCKEMYQPQYYLNADEYKNSEEVIQTNLEPPSKVLKTSKDYNDLYKYVLSSSRTILK